MTKVVSVRPFTKQSILIMNFFSFDIRYFLIRYLPAYFFGGPVLFNKFLTSNYSSIFTIAFDGSNSAGKMG